MVPTTALREARLRRRREKLATIIANEIIVDALAQFLDSQGRGEAVLDLGAGKKPYAPLYEPYFDRSVALDIGHSPHGTAAVDVIASADDMPFEDETFDCVICTEVLEHCRDPLGVLGEIRRVLRLGGSAFVTTPFMKGLHETPYDFYRYTPWALRDLGSRAGLDVERVDHRADWLAVALGIFLWPITKVLQAIGLYRYENPVTWLLVVAPQLMYLRYWRSGLTSSRFANAPLGFVAVMRRPVEADTPQGLRAQFE